jgi:hypothetical protein
MSTIAKFLFTPLISSKRKSKGPNSSLLDHPPPPIAVKSEWSFGPYSWKVTVEALDDDGALDKIFIGYSQNMNIADRTKGACDRHKRGGTTCGEPQMVMKGGECDEVIFMKSKNDSKLVPVF